MLNKKEKKKPLGAGIAWSDKDLNNLADISPGDMAVAASVWRNAAPKALQGLIDASVDDKVKETTSNEQQ